MPDPDMALVERCAEAAHEVNRTFVRLLGDDTNLPWRYAPDWQRKAVKDSVRFLLQFPQASDEDLHECWRAGKQLDGWKLGPPSTANRTNPYMKPFHELPPEYQAKDRLFRAVVLAIAARKEQ